MSSIAAWAAAVLPGSPAPLSPCSFLLPSPAPSPKPVDLTNLGYTTVFIHTLSRIVPTSPKQQLRSTPSILRRLRSVTKRVGTSSKKTKYARVPSPSLANDLQFAVGGNIDSHTNQVMKAQGARSQTGVYRDENGHLWWDEDKQNEYTHLLDGEGVDMYNYEGNEGDVWVRDSRSQQRSAPLAMDMTAGRPSNKLDRRESLSTPGSQLGARNCVRPIEDAAHPVVPGLSLLSVPSRARKVVGDAVKHLRKPEFLVDVDPFGRGTGKAFADTTSASRPKGKVKKRPAPLKIPSSASSSKKPSNSPPSSASWPSADSLRREFLVNSSEPMPQVLPSHATTSLAGVADPFQARLRAAGDSTEKPCRVNLHAMFGLGMSTS